jgi:hypothetical protein
MKNRKWKIFGLGEAEKEEKWLNEMSKAGKLLERVGIANYYFVDGEPGRYSYKLEFLEEEINHPKSKDYISFLEEAGIEYITSYGRWIYLRKEEEFSLYSNIDSRIEYYERIVKAVSAVEIVFLAGMPSIINLAVNTNISIYIKVPMVICYLLVGITIFAKGILPVIKERNRLKNLKEVEE